MATGLIMMTVLVALAYRGDPGPATPARVLAIETKIPPPLPPPPVRLGGPVFLESYPYLPPDAPRLTQSQVADVEVLLASDTRLKTLLAGVSYTIQDKGVWVSVESREGELIGAAVLLELVSPVSYTGSLPHVNYAPGPELDKLYSTFERPLQAQGIESLYVHVDLKDHSVVGVSVRDAAEVVYEDDQRQPFRWLYELLPVH